MGDALDLMATKTEHELIEYFVLDFTDVFFKLPLNVAEWPYFAARDKDTWMHWTRVAQGSRNGPQLFGRLSASVGLVTQGALVPQKARLRIFTDDPIATLKGTREETYRYKSRMIMLWRAPGFDLAFAKGQSGSSVVWIGHLITVHADRVEAPINP